MRTSKPIKIVVHMPEDMESFEKIYIDATLSAIKQIAEKTPSIKIHKTSCDIKKKVS